MFEDRPERSAEIVFAGRSNVGKSTIMRAITGHSFLTGRSPGVTRSPNFYDWASEDFLLTDLPGFGFMEGVPAERRESIKRDVVQYIEENRDEILVGVIVLNAKSTVDIIDRYENVGEVPYDIDMHGFFYDLDIPAVLAVNKMDKITDRNETLDAIAERFGFIPPWQQWQDVIAPISAKRGSIDALLEAIRLQLHAEHRDDLLKFF